jgi:anaerobic magnesium-protoporphyrin IX monomethyl ester cyclase
MRVFLIQAAAYRPEIERAMPLGIMYLASFLRERRGCEAGIVDMQLPGNDVSATLAKTRAFRPDVVGISGMTLDKKVIDALARGVKSELPGAAVVVGGSHASNVPEDAIANTAVDYVIHNEGETAFGDLIGALAGGGGLESVPSLYYRDGAGGEIRHTAPAPAIENLDEVPFPAFDRIDLEGYYRIPRCGLVFARKRYASMVTSRGCPYRCAYCHSVLGKRNRQRSPENVVNEMEALVRDFRIGEFILMDDMFNLSPERTDRIATLIVERGLDIRFSFPIGLRADIMTEQSVRLLKKAGMYRCMYAVETASPRIQSLIRKHNKLERVNEIIAYTRDQGVIVHGSFMMGFPTETEDEARATVDFAVRSRLHTAAFYRVIPFWGTDLYRMAVEAGKPIEKDMDSYEFHKSDSINVSEMPDDVLTRLRRSAYRRFYLNPARLAAIVWTLPNRLRLLPMLAAIWFRKAFLW